LRDLQQQKKQQQEQQQLVMTSSSPGLQYQLQLRDSPCTDHLSQDLQQHEQQNVQQ
jgi:hypothetical protein